MTWPKQGAIATAYLVSILATDKPDFAPGARFEYSNTNYLALAAIVAQVSGKPYGEYLQEQVFRPLGMTASGNGFAAQHGLAVPVGGQGDPRRPLSLDLFEGAGSVVSTAEDLLRWDQALLDGRLLKPESMRLLWTAGEPAAGRKQLRDGLCDGLAGRAPGGVAQRADAYGRGVQPECDLPGRRAGDCGAEQWAGVSA